MDNTLKTDLPPYFRYELITRYRFGAWEHRYVCEAAEGAVEFYVKQSASTTSYDEWYGGFELHSATATGDGPPDHGQCSALSTRPCWHEGTSSWATDYWIPLWRLNPHDHETIFRRLADEFVKRFRTN